MNVTWKYTRTPCFVGEWPLQNNLRTYTTAKINLRESGRQSTVIDSHRRPDNKYLHDCWRGFQYQNRNPMSQPTITVRVLHTYRTSRIRIRHFQRDRKKTQTSNKKTICEKLNWRPRPYRYTNRGGSVSIFPVRDVVVVVVGCTRVWKYRLIWKRIFRRLGLKKKKKKCPRLLYIFPECLGA